MNTKPILGRLIESLEGADRKALKVINRTCHRENEMIQTCPTTHPHRLL